MSIVSTTTTPVYRHESWSSRLAFILAATGSAVGLGNIWKFPYITGEYGGGAFVLVYLLCIALVGLPIMMAEVLIGRRGRQSPIHSMRIIAEQEGRSSLWQLAGWSGVMAGFIILSFYSVIAGWAIAFVVYAAGGDFTGASTERIGGLFSALLGNPAELMLWHTVFMGLTVYIVVRGVKAGLERAVSILMPALFALLLILVGYAIVSTGKFGVAITFLFRPDFSRLSTEAVLTAMGQAFFSLSLGMGAMLAYGSYLPRGIPIAGTAITVCIADTVVALTAGLIIFPIVFANGLEASAGPGLIFQTLPLAFGHMPGGVFFGTLFFILLTFAAWSSSIALLEPAVEWLQEHRGVTRTKASVVAGVGAWVLGIVTVLSFNLWSGIKPWGKSLFDLLDYLTSNIMLPLGGLLFALFSGWVMAKTSTEDELEMDNTLGYRLWRFVVRYIAPVGVSLVFLYNLL